MEVEKRLNQMSLALPADPMVPGGLLAPVRTGNLLFVPGMIPFLADKRLLNPGKLGRDVTVEQGYQSARMAMLNLLTIIKSAIGDLDKVNRVVKLLCMINATPEFSDHPSVANGASELLVALYGDRGRHARAAVGMGSLPLNSCVEIEMIVEVAD